MGQRNLDHWTVSFMVGLGLVEPDVPRGPLGGSKPLRLTGNGERLYQLLRRIPGIFNEGTSGWDIAQVVQSFRHHPQVYDEVRKILSESPALWNFQLFLARRKEKGVGRNKAFYSEFGRSFGLPIAAFNRVPSVVEMAQFCGVLSARGSRLSNEVAIEYSRPKHKPSSPIERAVRRRAPPQTEESEEEIERFLADIGQVPPRKRKVLAEVISRNLVLADRLKRLYHGRCQICGSTFRKRDGSPYSESHHLVPLGRNGADAPSNIVVLCATCHRKFHYADVRLLPPSGGGTPLVINGKDVQLRYAPVHFRSLS